MKKLILSVAVCLSATVSAQQFKVVSLHRDRNAYISSPLYARRQIVDGLL